MCLALGGATATAQSPAASPVVQAEWAAVTGTSSCGDVTSEGTSQFITPPYTLTGMVMACTKFASDRRVDGLATYVFNVETWDPDLQANAVAWGDEEIKGPEGTWTGCFYGVYDDDGVLHLVHILAGSGAYEGWTYAYSSTVPADVPTATTIGVVHHSAPPPGLPVGPLPSPASE
jgi:hypothetical protein